ncbi:acetate--CoA ligase family protein [Salidesulfovibrio onnuriiensis]|uniref:acetate--CoA ligase family protein n=1 Tax=Salidesulfovibrio onnuriiensis TaxID=2583823 RepID=UPI0011CB8E79|nr:acetate--CoA ligase family protein [Salidesulfovibrio onnuriiensis]
MQTYIDFDKLDAHFRNAMEDGRTLLYEYETYSVLRDSGAESVPKINFLLKGTRPSNEELNSMPGHKAVMKIVSPTIVHKTEVGGVKIIEKDPGKIRSTWRRMMDEVPVNYARWIELHPDMAPEAYKGLAGENLLRAIARDVKGVLLCQFMPPDSLAFGNELLVSIRRTREFGMVLTAGLGGTDTELYASRFRKGQAVVSASTAQTDGDQFFKLFTRTIAYRKLAGLSRGQQRIISDDQLKECFSSFIEMANRYSPGNPEAPVVIEELEVNPFAFTDYQMVPLDGMCRFSLQESLPEPRPVHKIHNLLHPKRIGIIGVSEKRANFGRIILKNVLSCGFPAEYIAIVRPGVGEIDGVKCVESLQAMGKVDLFIVAVGAAQVPDLAEELIDRDLAESVMLIPGGLGETEESKERAGQLIAKINEAHKTGSGPVFLGGNCLGVLSHPGSYDTIFIPEEKLPKRRGGKDKRAAFISQSGAFMITRASKLAQLDPAYMISIGNQTDLTAGDFVNYFKEIDDIDVIAMYMEGFNDMDGLSFCRAVRQAVKSGKEVLFYKAGRTPEGKSATSGHTASVAGDYMVCESCVRQAGAQVADTFTRFEDLYLLATRFHGRQVRGNRLAAVSGAGFEAVGMADSIQGDDFHMTMARFSEESREKLGDLLQEYRLDSLVEVKNPMDINPAANDRLHTEVTRILAEDDGVDGLVVGLDPLSPSMHTLPEGQRTGESLDAEESIARIFPELVRGCAKPVIGVVDGGRLYDPLADRLEEQGVPVFRSSDRAVTALAKYIEGRLYADALRQDG